MNEIGACQALEFIQVDRSEEAEEILEDYYDADKYRMM